MKIIGNMYEFVNKKPNPLAGECLHGCSYCYVTKMKVRYSQIKAKYSGEPRVYEHELSKKYKEIDFVFVCDCNDLFAKNVPAEIIIKILSTYKHSPAKLFFQTKNPGRIVNEFIEYMPKGAIICTTIETNRFYTKNMGLAPLPIDRAISMHKISESGFETQVTVEPIMDFDMDKMVALIRICNPAQVNIGADSGKNNLPEPGDVKILSLIDSIKPFTVVKIKTNLARLLPCKQ